MTGVPVRDAQWLMQGNSVFGPGLATYKGEIDSQYGPRTAVATSRTKWWLGYPSRSCDQVFGQILYEYLNPNIARPLPADYKARRAERLVEKTPGQRALAYATGQIGYTETPRGSNLTKYGAWYRWNGVPWCAIFESYCFAHMTGPRPSYRYAAVEAIWHDASMGRNGLRLTMIPAPGDIVCYALGGSTFAHTAFFEKWTQEGRTFQDVGGNTGPSNISNGGAVLRQTRNVDLVYAWVRVG
jgi:hypothetical protein